MCFTGILFCCRSALFVGLWGAGCGFTVKLHSFWKCCLQRFPKQTEAARPRALGDLPLPGCSSELALSVKGLLADVFLCGARCVVHTEASEWPTQTRGWVKHPSRKGDVQAAFLLWTLSPLVCPMGASHRHSHNTISFADWRLLN